MLSIDAFLRRPCIAKMRFNMCKVKSIPLSMLANMYPKKFLTQITNLSLLQH